MRRQWPWLPCPHILVIMTTCTVLHGTSTQVNTWLPCQNIFKLHGILKIETQYSTYVGSEKARIYVSKRISKKTRVKLGAKKFKLLRNVTKSLFRDNLINMWLSKQIRGGGNKKFWVAKVSGTKCIKQAHVCLKVPGIRYPDKTYRYETYRYETYRNITYRSERYRL